MQAISGQGRRQADPRSTQGQRKGLLAKIQVAKHQSRMPDLIYRDILRERFGVETSTALSIKEMEEMVSIFIEEHGWVPSYHAKHGPSQIAALQERIWQVAGEIPQGRSRLPGLCETILEVGQVSWCKDYKKLTRLLAVLEKIKRSPASTKKSLRGHPA